MKSAARLLFAILRAVFCLLLLLLMCPALLIRALSRVEPRKVVNPWLDLHKFQLAMPGPKVVCTTFDCRSKVARDLLIKTTAFLMKTIAAVNILRQAPVKARKVATK